ncbi:MAG: hypothetical protein NT091_04465 [Candidatus Falkowbacteria bacterium]|nr:hypothetical protein [Candidatus Falkowbacteria bacterium]
MQYFKKYNLILGFCFLLLASPALATEGDNFNSNLIIADSDILNTNAMTYQEVVDFLHEKKSFLANYITTNADGVTMDAAQIIYNAAVNNYDCDGVSMSQEQTKLEKQVKCKPISINPQFLLVLLQKEQSLIEDVAPRQSQLDYATGYGCPDGGGCNDRWKGFGKQVNSAALQFFEYMNKPERYPYQAGNLYKFTSSYLTDPEKQMQLVRPANRATAALYDYTPHVYNGNYNFYKIWQRYFTRDLLEGTLVQADGEVGVWLIKNGKKIPFLSKTALTSRYDVNKIIQVKAADLASYPVGAAIKFPQYSVVKTPDGILYLLVDDKKRKIASKAAFKKIGYNPEEVEEVTIEDLQAYQDGEPITGTSLYPTGALLQDKKTGGVYFVMDGTKAPIWDKIFLKTKFKNKKIVKVSTKELATYTDAPPVMFEDGELLKSSNSSSVFVISTGKKRPIPSGIVFTKAGFKWENVIPVNPNVLYLYPNGDPLL